MMIMCRKSVGLSFRSLFVCIGLLLFLRVFQLRTTLLKHLRSIKSWYLVGLRYNDCV